AARADDRENGKRSELEWIQVAVHPAAARRAEDECAGRDPKRDDQRQQRSRDQRCPDGALRGDQRRPSVPSRTTMIGALLPLATAAALTLSLPLPLQWWALGGSALLTASLTAVTLVVAATQRSRIA